MYGSGVVRIGARASERLEARSEDQLQGMTRGGRTCTPLWVPSSTAAPRSGGPATRRWRVRRTRHRGRRLTRRLRLLAAVSSRRTSTSPRLPASSRSEVRCRPIIFFPREARRAFFLAADDRVALSFSRLTLALRHRVPQPARAAIRSRCAPRCEGDARACATAEAPARGRCSRCGCASAGTSARSCERARSARRGRSAVAEQRRCCCCRGCCWRAAQAAAGAAASALIIMPAVDN